MRTAKATVRLIILIFSAFLSVAIQIFLYVRKYNKELNVFRMLGMSWWGIYEISLFGHICNVGIGAIGMYILLQNNGIRLPENITKHIDENIWELRPGSNRIFYFCCNNNQFILLHSFRKKTQKTPRREIEKAKSERDHYLSRKETNQYEYLE